MYGLNSRPTKGFRYTRLQLPPVLLAELMYSKRAQFFGLLCYSVASRKVGGNQIRL
jgi:hypothetical protein